MAEVGALRITLGLNSIDFTNGMKQADQRLKALNAEFKAISTGAAKFDNSLATLRDRADVLTRSMQVHRAKAEELRRQYEDSKRTKGEDADETVRLAASYNRAVAAMNNTEQQLQNVNRRIDEQTDSFRQLENSVNTSLDGINRELRVLQSSFAASTAGIKDFGNSTDDLRQKEEHLSQTVQLQQRQVQELQRLYDESAQAKGTDAEATQEITIRLNQARQALIETRRALNDTTQEIQQQSNTWNQLSSRVGEIGATIQEKGSALREFGQGMSAAVTLPIVGFATAAGKLALDFEASSGRIEARLGTTKERAAELDNVAQVVWKDAFGENVREAADTVAIVSTNLKDLSNDGLKQATEAAYFLSDAFNADVNDSTKTASALMKNFGIDATKAFDIITTGFQQGGDFSGELLDTLNEYSVQFSSVGLSAERFLGILINGAKAGAFNLDKVGDAVKEFNIRAQDGSKTTAQGFEAIGLNAEKMGSAIAKGGEEGQKAFVATISALAAIQDPLKQNQAGVALFGTQWEDVRKKVIFAMSDAVKNVQNVDGATKKASDAIQNNFGTRLQKVWRDFQKDMEPVGEDLLKIAEDDLPKLADGVGKVVGAFADMSPEAQKTVLVLGGIAAAAGPVLMGVGMLTSGIGALTAGAAPLIGLLGGEAGLAGAFTLLTGPVGLTVAGLGLATAATLGIMDASKKAKEVNLEHAKSLIDQQQSLESLIKQYETLRDKNKLSNDELLQFKDIQDRLKTAGIAQEVEALSKQADTLREKSGLSNSELLTMLDLNDKLIEKVPTAGQVISNQGNAVLKNADDLKKANEAMREKIRLELEAQKAKADASLDKTISEQAKAVDAYMEKMKEVEKIQNSIETDQAKLAELKNKQRQEEEAGHTRVATAMNNEIMLLEGQIRRQQQNVSAVADEMLERGKSVEQKNVEIQKIQEIYTQLINLQLAQAGINATGAEGIAQLDQAIQKTQARIIELDAAKERQGSLTAEQQKELDTLSQALGVYQGTKGEIQNIQQEQANVNSKIEQGTKNAEGMNSELGKDVNKNVNVDDHGGAKQITDEAGKGANKNVNVTDGGTAGKLHSEASKPAIKDVIFQAIFPPGFTAAVKAFEMVSGINVPGFAVGTRNAPGGLSLVGENGPELVYLPKGSRVIPNQDTEAILQKWNIPMMATGGVTLTSGMAFVGEKGVEAIDMRGATVANASPASVVAPSQTFNLHIYNPKEADILTIKRQQQRAFREMAFSSGGM